MRPHRIISAFRSHGRLVSPPGTWTPPTQAVADRLIAAKCLRAPAIDEPEPAEPAEPETGATELKPEPEPEPAEPEGKPKRKRKRGSK